MLIVHQELLPQAYLLVLASSTTVRPRAELAAHLHQAVRSNRPAVWVDCRLLEALPPTVARLLRRYHYCLGQQQRQLLLCRVSEELARSLQAAGAVPAAGFALVESLDEAAGRTPLPA